MAEQKIILLVEDDKKLNEINFRALKNAGYNVLSAFTLKEAKNHLMNCSPDVILLDVMLPDGNGIDFCRQIQGEVESHILFLTSCAEHEDMLRGLESGGDDYITKPYKLDAMLARVSAVMRRREMAKSHAPALQKGSLRMDAITGVATVNGKDLQLTPKQFTLLAQLMSRAGQPIAKEELFEVAWGQPMGGDSNALWQQMSRLKKKLETISEGEITILQSRNEGYSLDMVL